MSEFRKLEAEVASCAESLQSPALLPENVDALKARLTAAASAVAKHNSKKNEQSEVTTAEFLARLQEFRSKADDAEQALADALEEEEEEEVMQGGEEAQGSGVEASVGMEEDGEGSSASASVPSASKKMSKKQEKVANLESQRDEARAALEVLEAERAQHTEVVPRYGSAMIARIDALSALHQSLAADVLPRAYLNAQAHAESAAMVEEKARQAAAQREAEEVAAQRIAAIKAAEEARRVEAAQQAEAAAVEAAAAEAKRAKEVAEKVIQEERKAFEDQAKRWPKGEEGMRQAIALLVDSHTSTGTVAASPPAAAISSDGSLVHGEGEASESAPATTATDGNTGESAAATASTAIADAQSAKVALQAVAALLAGLVAHPDDEKRRTIRLHNERFHSDLGQWRGGKECFYAAGFKIVHRLSTQADAFTGLPYVEPLLCLLEPDPMVDLDGWSKWFDNLKVCADICSIRIPGGYS